MDPVALDHEFVQSLDLASAVEGAHPGNLFPSYVAWSAASLDGQVATETQASLGRSYRPQALEVVRVPKWDRSTRPAVDMPVEDRIVYAAISNSVRDSVHAGLVTFTGLAEEGQSYRDFEQFPLASDGVAYVLEADVASFYEYVDHQRLSNEVLGLTGKPELAEALADLLEVWMGRPFGLPQGPTPSSILADVYISPAGRTLHRAGLRFSRYSDDFRVLAGEWAEARRAQLILETALRAVGLVVAPRKLRTLKIETYRTALERANDPRVRTALRIPGAEELLAEEYPDDGEMSTPTTVEQALAADQVLRELIEEKRVGVTETRLARAALRRLGPLGTGVVYGNLGKLLSRYAHLTQWVSTNLRAAMGTDAEAAALEAIDTWLRRPWFRYPWQVGWLLYAANHAAGRHSSLGEWAAMAMFDEGLPWFARAQAAIAAGRHSDLPQVERYFDLWERAPDAARPDLLAAVVIRRPQWAEQFIEGARMSALLAKVADLPADDFREWL